MTSDAADESTDETTILFDNPLDFFVIGVVSGLFTIGVVAFTVHTWQVVIQEDAVILPFLVGAVVALGTIFTLPILVDRRSD